MLFFSTVHPRFIIFILLAPPRSTSFVSFIPTSSKYIASIYIQFVSLSSLYHVIHPLFIVYLFPFHLSSSFLSLLSLSSSPFSKYFYTIQPQIIPIDII